MAQNSDPWQISPEDRKKHESQFNALTPVDGLLSGEKARGIFMKSGLPVGVLGHIWNLADMNKDGSLNLHEYSVAIHLVRHKLRGGELPKALPPSLLHPPRPQPHQPQRPLSQQPQPPVRPVQPRPQQLQQRQVQPQVVAQPPQQRYVQPQVVRQPQPQVVRQPQAMRQPQPQPQPQPPRPSQTRPQQPIPTQARPRPPQPQQPQRQVVPAQPRPVVPQPRQQAPLQQPQQRQPTPQQRQPQPAPVATVQQPSSLEWAISPPQIERYSVVFKKLDKNNRGHLTGSEVKAVLSKSGLANKILAQIWNLSDVDDDGSLTEEEFFLAMHFIEASKAGHPLPASLSPQYMPPSMRKVEPQQQQLLKQQQQQQRNTSTYSQPHKPPGVTQTRPLSTVEQLPLKPIQPNLVHHTPPTQPKQAFNVKIKPLAQVSQSPVKPRVTFQETPADNSVLSDGFYDNSVPDAYETAAAAGGGGFEEDAFAAATTTEAFNDEAFNKAGDDNDASNNAFGDNFNNNDNDNVDDFGDNFGDVSNQYDTQAAEIVESTIATATEATAYDDDDEMQQSVQQTVQQQLQQQQQLEVTPEEALAYKVVEEVMSTLPSVISNNPNWPEDASGAGLEDQNDLGVGGLEEAEAGQGVSNVNVSVCADEDDVGYYETGGKTEEQMAREREMEEEVERKKEEERQIQIEKQIEHQKEMDKQRKEEAERKKKEEEERLKKIREEKERAEEVERKRKEESDKQKKEEFERYRKAEEEKKRQAEEEKKRQIEKEKEEHRKKAQQLKEAQMLEEQRQRQLEWERQRKDQLILLRAREQNSVETLEKETAKLKKTLAVHEKKRAELDVKLTKARGVLKEFTNVIEDMREKRDLKMAEMSEISSQLEENKRKLQISEQERGLGEKQLSLVDSHLGETFKMVLNRCNKKRTVVSKLNEQLKKNDADITSKLQSVEKNNEKLAEKKALMTVVHDEVKALKQALREKRHLWECSKEKNKQNFNYNQCNTVAAVESYQEPDANRFDQKVEGHFPYTAMFPFEARSSDELTFNTGDVIWVDETSVGMEEGWLKGCLNGKQGIFPEAYVHRVEKYEAAVEAVSVQASPGTTETESYTAMYAYNSEEAGDLVFQEGEVIMVERKEGEWWKGRIGQRQGFFPANFVTPTPQAPPSAPTQPVAPMAPTQVNAGPKLTVMRKPEIATAIASYECTGEGQLSLQPGHLIQVKRKSETGWWEGELQVRGQQRKVGWFPCSFVKLLGKSRHSADCFNSERPQNFKVPTAPAPEKRVALYDFTSDRSAELTFKKGDVIMLISKTHPDWWSGELNGAQGIFPASFVAPHQDA